MSNSWLKIKSFIPFRRKYFYWDESVSNDIFLKKGIKIKFLYKFTHPHSPYIGIIFSCKRKDAKKVEAILDILNEEKSSVDENYVKFLKMWRSQDIIIFSKERLSYDVI